MSDIENTSGFPADIWDQAVKNADWLVGIGMTDLGTITQALAFAAAKERARCAGLVSKAAKEHITTNKAV